MFKAVLDCHCSQEDHLYRNYNDLPPMVHTDEVITYAHAPCIRQVVQGYSTERINCAAVVHVA